MKPVRTLVVVADGGNARFFRHDGPGKPLEELAGAGLSAALLPNREIMSDKPGRAFESATHGRSAYEPKSDPRELMEAGFARKAVDAAGEMMAGGEAERLVLCADPTTLGTMRKALPKALEAKLAGTLNRDLTKVALNDLPKHLAGLLPV